MAGPPACCNFFRAGKDELAEETATDGSSTSIISRILTPALSQVFALTQAPASAIDPPDRYRDENLQKTTKLALKSFVKDQKHG